ncbi:AraC family transcriptional regulator [Taklimakanibacter deserti]|uniref:AraC family transcriptional regulator n=1 Tax=Taklimakanibacter deserti TaxID=2267839 RepID=UPI000E65C287
MLRCGMAGVEAVLASTRHVFPRHTHDQFGIGVIHQGAHRSLSGRGMVEAGTGDVITVNPGEVHDGAPIGDHGRSWRILYFDPAVISAVVADMSEGKTKAFEFSHPVLSGGPLIGRFGALFAAMTKGGEAPLEREELLLLLFAALRPKAGKEPHIPDAIRSVRQLIDDDPASPLTLAALAQEAGLSRFQLLRAFCKATGLTPHAYVMQRRIALARRLIAARLPLAQAAFAAGFADQSHMTRIFVRKYGVSPRTYAKAVG